MLTYTAIVVLIYALLFMEWDERGGKPIEEVCSISCLHSQPIPSWSSCHIFELAIDYFQLRTYIFGSIKGAFSAPPSQASMRRPNEEVSKE